MIGYIYTLSCPKSNTVIYVGSTMNSIEHRAAQHVSDSKIYNYPILKYIRNNGIVPIIEVIEECKVKNRKSLYEIENYWIDQFRQWGFKLHNHSGNHSVVDSSFCDDVIEPFKSVKISRSTYNKLLDHKRSSGVPVAAFIDISVEEEFKRIKK